MRAVVGAAILLHDLLVWAGGPVWSFIARTRPLARLAAWVATLPRWGVLVVLALPLAVAEPLKLGGLLVMVRGQVTLGVGLQIFGHALSILLVERILHAGAPQLMTYGWFAWGWRYLDGVRRRVLAWPAVTAARAAARRIAADARVLARRARDRLGF